MILILHIERGVLNFGMLELQLGFKEAKLLINNFLER